MFEYWEGTETKNWYGRMKGSKTKIVQKDQILTRTFKKG